MIPPFALVHKDKEPIHVQNNPPHTYTQRQLRIDRFLAYFL